MDSNFKTQYFFPFESILTFSFFVVVLLLSILSPIASSASSEFCDARISHGHSGCGVSLSSSSKILIKGGIVVNAHHQEVSDVYIDDGIIVDVKPNIKVGDEVTIIDATGKFVMPGIRSAQRE